MHHLREDGETRKRKRCTNCVYQERRKLTREREREREGERVKEEKMRGLWTGRQWRSVPSAILFCSVLPGRKKQRKSKGIKGRWRAACASKERKRKRVTKRREIPVWFVRWERVTRNQHESEKKQKFTPQNHRAFLFLDDRKRKEPREERNRSERREKGSKRRRERPVNKTEGIPRHRTVSTRGYSAWIAAKIFESLPNF